WNMFGGLVACREIIKDLSQQQPGLKPLSPDSFEEVNQLAPGGDLANLLGLDVAEISEDNAVSFTPKTNLPPLETGVNFTRDSKASGSAVVFCDSFGDALKPFLGYSFGKTTYVVQHELDTRAIEREKPVVVITEVVEREFNVNDPKKMMARESLK